MALDVILPSIYGISCATMELYEQVKHLFHDLKPPIPKVSSSSYRLYPPTLFDDIRSEVNDHHGFLVRLTHNLVVALGWWSIDFAPWLLEMSGRVAVVMARVTELVVHINALHQELPGFNWMIVPTVTSQWPPPTMPPSTTWTSTYGTQTMLSDNMSWMSSQLSGLNSLHASSSGTMTTPTRTRSQWPPPTMSSSRTRSFTQTTPSDKSTQWSSSSLSGSNTLASSSKTTTSQLSLPATSYSGTPSKCTSSSSTMTRSRVRPSSTVPSSTNDRVAHSSSMGSRTSSHSDTASFCSTRAYSHYSGISYRPTK